MSKLPNPSNKYGVLSVAQYYSHLGQTKKIDWPATEKYFVLKIFRDINTSKPAGIITSWKIPKKWSRCSC